MRVLTKLLWVAAFLVATFAWMVLFEHGFSVDGFRQGVTQEWQELMGRFDGGVEAPPAESTPEAPSTPEEPAPQ